MSDIIRRVLRSISVTHFVLHLSDVMSPYYFFFFHDTATTEIYTLSLHDALPIWAVETAVRTASLPGEVPGARDRHSRSEEHTSELQSRQYLVCRLLLEKKKNRIIDIAENTVTVITLRVTIRSARSGQLVSRTTKH